jgi:anti-sigma B factor antagonist
MITYYGEKIDQVFVLGVNGRIDLDGAKIFLEEINEILDSGQQYILIDFTDVAYINSTGLRALILVAKRLKSSGGKFVLAGVIDSIQKVLKISGLDSLLTILPTKAEGLASFSQ